MSQGQGSDNDAMHDLASDAPNAYAADENFEEDDSNSMDEISEEFDTTNAELADSDDSNDHGNEDMNVGQQFADDGTIEDAFSDAIDAESAEELFRRLLAGIRRSGEEAESANGTKGSVRYPEQDVGRFIRRGGSIAGRVTATNDTLSSAGIDERTSATATGVANQLQQARPIFQQYVAHGFDEIDAFDDLADWLEEEQADLALPLMAGLAARALARPLLRQGRGEISRSVRRQIVRRAGQAARILVRQRGPTAARALPALARSVGRIAVRQNLAPGVTPRALQQAATQVAARPQLLRRLIGQTVVAGDNGNIAVHRFRIRGPVEITISTL